MAELDRDTHLYTKHLKMVSSDLRMFGSNGGGSSGNIYYAYLCLLINEICYNKSLANVVYEKKWVTSALSCILRKKNYAQNIQGSPVKVPRDTELDSKPITSLLY